MGLRRCTCVQLYFFVYQHACVFPRAARDVISFWMNIYLSCSACMHVFIYTRIDERFFTQLQDPNLPISEWISSSSHERWATVRCSLFFWMKQVRMSALPRSRLWKVSAWASRFEIYCVWIQRKTKRIYLFANPTIHLLHASSLAIL